MNFIYDSAREAFLAGDASWRDDNIKVMLVDANDYVADQAAHQFLTSVPAAARVATSANLTSKTVTDGVADAADVVFSAVNGDPSEALIYYQDTGVEGTSLLLAYFDTATNLPVTPNGGDINLGHDNGANKIFKL